MTLPYEFVDARLHERREHWGWDETVKDTS
jgi:hypothetical protein